MPLWGHISRLHFRLDCVLFWVTLRTIVFTDLRSVPGKWNLRKGRQHVGLSALVAVSDWMTGFIKYDKIRSEPWQVWSLSSAKSLASRASDETQFLDSAAVQKKLTCDAFVDKHNELEKQQNVVTQVWCQYQMVGKRHKGRKLASHPSSLMHHERQLQRHYVRFRVFLSVIRRQTLWHSLLKNSCWWSLPGKKSFRWKNVHFMMATMKCLAWTQGMSKLEQRILRAWRLIVQAIKGRWVDSIISQSVNNGGKSVMLFV